MGGGDGGDAGASGQAGKKGPKAKAKGKDLKQEAPGGAQETAPKKVKTSLDKAMAEAGQVKKDYTTAVLTATELQKRSEKEKGWGWATEDLAVLAGLLTSLNGALGKFGAVFLTADVKDIKKEYQDRHQILEAELNNFVKQCKDRAEEVTKQNKLMTALQARRGLA